MPRKTKDPALVALYDQADKAMNDFDRAFTRLTRAVNRCNKLKARLKRLGKRIAERESNRPMPGQSPGAD